MTLASERVASWDGTKVVLSHTRSMISLIPSPEMNCDSLFTKARTKRLTLVLHGVTAASDPSVPFNIFINLPERAGPDRNDPGYVSALNFYGMPNRQSDVRSVRYEVSRHFQRLKQSGRGKCPIVLTFVTSAPPRPGSYPGIALIELLQH
jgi:hypothetical protein